MTLALIGYAGPVHVGAHLRQAAEGLGLGVDFFDVAEAFTGPPWMTTLSRRLLGRRPPRLQAFGRTVVRGCRTRRPRWLLATGLAPLSRDTLEALRALGISCFNYLTDDPWNPAHRAPWFLDALARYDRVFSPRHANLDALRRLGCPDVAYLPFAYNPAVHFPERPETPEDRARFACDVVFAGGADRNRLPWISALLRVGFRTHLYGGYWDRFPLTRPHHRGQADPVTLRRATGGARVALSLVRRANRDGHAMRTFELPAMGACPLMEDTADHRTLFGEEGQATVYFRTIPEMLEKLRWLLAHDAERYRLAEAAHRVITQGRHTYRDRLATMLGLA